MKSNYEILTMRNGGYLNEKAQELISKKKVLIAGCGIGSQVAEALARIGFQHFSLVDGDTVDAHNLNRQSFFHDQIGKNKVDALKENILRINPDAKVSALAENLTPRNAAEILNHCDIAFDTIDFLDLKGIVGVHDEAHKKGVPLISSFAVGFGAAVISLPPSQHSNAYIRDIFDLPKSGDIGEISYVERFQKLFMNLAPGLDPSVLQVMTDVFKKLADGVPCPAPQVIPGAQSVASLSVTAAVRLLTNQSLITGPEMQVLNLIQFLNSPGFKLA